MIEAQYVLLRCLKFNIIFNHAPLPLQLRTLATPVRLTNPKALALPRSYVYCNNPAMGFFEAFAERTRAEKGWNYHELATGHDAMITMARPLADLLLACISLQHP